MIGVGHSFNRRCDARAEGGITAKRVDIAEFKLASMYTHGVTEHYSFWSYRLTPSVYEVFYSISETYLSAYKCQVEFEWG